MICPYCKQPAIWCENSEIYGRRYGRSYMCYLCQPCNAYVGCHNNSKRALGTLANKELREWRMKAHAIFDPIWRKSKNNKFKTFNDRKRRYEAYEWLSRELNKISIHIGWSDVEDCKKIISICENHILNSKHK